jgi:hypothetical protein
MTATAISRPRFSEAFEISPGSSTFDPEFEFLLACCRDEPMLERRQRFARVLANKFDWERLLRLASSHGVVPRVYGALAASSGLAPARWLEALRFHTQRNVRQSLLFTGELFRILDHFKSRDIEALAYKGPVLAHLLYEDVTGRQFGDLDFLIRKSDVARARTALGELEYRPALELTSGKEKDYLISGYEYSFSSPRGRNIVELQWQVLPRFYCINFDIDAIFGRAIAAKLEGRSLATLCAEDLFLLLCVHAAKHGWAQLCLLTDLHQLAKSPALDWNIIWQRASERGVQRIVEVNLLLANKLLGTPMPDGIENASPGSAAFRLAQGVESMLAAGPTYRAESLSYFIFMMRLREKWRVRVQFLWRLALTPSVGEWSAIPLPATLSPMYRLVRVFRLLRRFASRH